MSMQQAAQQYAANPQRFEQAQQKFQEMLSRSATDPQFRQKLLTDPRAAVEEFSGKPAPEDFNVVFIENKAAATIVLPDPVDANAELSEQELEAVAGGLSWLGVAASLLAVYDAWVDG